MDLLKSGQKLSIYFQKGENLVEIACVIRDIFEDRMIIDLPQYFMRYIEYLEEGKPLTVKVFTKMGTIDFNTVVISSPIEDDFAVELDYNAMKIVPDDKMPSISAMEKLIITINDIAYNFKTFELAADYLKFYSDKNLKVGDSCPAELILSNNYGIIKFDGIITEIDPIYDNEYTMQYSMITENDKQKLIYYMYLYSNDAE